MSAIAIIAERLLPQRGGLAKATARIAAMAAESSQEVHAISLSDEVAPGVRSTRSQGKITVHEVGRLPDQEATLRAWTEHAAEVVSETQASIVHGIYGMPAGFVATTVGAFCGVVSTVSLRGNDFDRGIFRPTLPQLTQAITRATMVTAVTRVMARRAQAFFGRPVSFVPNSVEGSDFGRRSPDNTLRASLGLGDAQVLGFSGELREKKGIRFLLPAFAALTKERDVRLLLIGGVRDDAQQAMQAFARAEPAAYERIHSLRYDDDPEKLSVRLGLCDALVFPSLQEGMPNAVLEAMAAQCAVLATDVGGHGELIEHGVSGALLALSDLDRLPEAMGEMLDLPEETRRSMGKAARNFVCEMHSPEIERAAWQQIYAQARADAPWRRSSQEG